MNKLVDPTCGFGRVAVEAALRQAPEVELPLRHIFADNVYYREMTIPSGTIVLGKIHKYDTLLILLKGELTVASDNGPVRLSAPSVTVGRAGRARLGYAHTEVVCANVHGTSLTDLEELEEYFIAKSEEDFALFQQGLLEEKL